MRIGNTLVKLPPRPVIRELLALLAAEVTRQVEKEIGPNVGVIGRATLQQIIHIATTEIGRNVL